MTPFPVFYVTMVNRLLSKWLSLVYVYIKIGILYTHLYSSNIVCATVVRLSSCL